VPDGMPQDQKAYNEQVIEEFRANDGVLGPPFSGEGLLLLTTTGGKSGAQRTTPMMFVDRGDDVVMVIASNMGAPLHPDWYRNLVANPVVTVERPHRAPYEARARTATGDERTRLWEDLVGGYPFFADHQAGAEREIPLVLVEPIG
jgi:deazaflavin-dependent oxidoreductase (nitroreductase family)